MSAFKYKVYKEEEVTVDYLLEEGSGNFEITKAQVKKSKKGYEQIEVQFKVWDKKGKQATIFDYFCDPINMPTEGSQRFMAWKTRRLFDAINSLDVYEKGEFDPSFLDHKSGDCIIKNESYVDQNNNKKNRSVIKEYCKSTESKRTQCAAADEFFDDPINF